jgi:trigger factor
MDIKRVALDAVNETIVITVVHMDYKGQVKKNKRKNAFMTVGLEKGCLKILLKNTTVKQK